jgi:hypothetical protein
MNNLFLRKLIDGVYHVIDINGEGNIVPVKMDVPSEDYCSALPLPSNLMKLGYSKSPLDDNCYLLDKGDYVIKVFLSDSPYIRLEIKNMVDNEIVLSVKQIEYIDQLEIYVNLIV